MDDFLSRTQKRIIEIEYREKYVSIFYPIFIALSFLILSYFIMRSDVGYLDRSIFVFIGLIIGIQIARSAKNDLQERKMILEGYVNSVKPKVQVEPEPAPVPAKLADTVPISATLPVDKVEIPSNPIVPNIPSMAVPADVKEVLKDKGRPTKVPLKKKIKP